MRVRYQPPRIEFLQNLTERIAQVAKKNHFGNFRNARIENLQYGHGFNQFDWCFSGDAANKCVVMCTQYFWIWSTRSADTEIKGPMHNIDLEFGLAGNNSNEDSICNCPGRAYFLQILVVLVLNSNIIGKPKMVPCIQSS